MLSVLLRNFSSNRSQLGLWHGKDIRTGNTYSFSNRAHKRTFKPNVFTKLLWSNILKRHLSISVSSKAYKTIEKRGSLDDYILKTSPAVMRSRFGETLRSHLQNKLKNPDYQVPYIKGTWKARKTLREKEKSIYSSVFHPIEIRYKDHSENYFNVYDPNPPERPELADEEEEEGEPTEPKDFKMDNRDLKDTKMMKGIAKEMKAEGMVEEEDDIQINRKVKKSKSKVRRETKEQKKEANLKNQKEKRAK